MGLSVAVITFNEEENIVRFLDAVTPIADEIIVLDSFSTDKTKELALKYGKVKFYENQFEGFGFQKNKALEHCSEEWVLFLDTDEIPNESLINSIRKVIAQEISVAEVFTIELINHIGKKIIKYGGWSGIYRERFFKKNAAKYSEDKVHEFLIYDSKAEKLPGEILHFTYKDIHHHIEKSNIYTTLMAKKMFENGKKSNGFKIFLKPKFQFFKTYFLKMGFLDGISGYYIAKTSAYYTFLKYSKLRELQK